MSSYAKYSLVPTEEPKEVEVDKHYPSAFDYNSAFSYKSAFDYHAKNGSQFKSAFDYGYGQKTPSVSLNIGEKGRLKGVLGPGTVFIIPWLDRHTKIDMRTKAFSVPPQQLITADNGIIEMGCEVKYRVSDVQKLTTSVTTPEHGLRSFGKTVLLNVLTKHTVKEMERDRSLISAEVQKELNFRVLEWGIEIGEVDLSTVNILKEPDANNPLKPLMHAFGAISSGGGDSANPLLSKMSEQLMPALSEFADFGKVSGFSVTGMEDQSRSRSQAAGDTDLLLDSPEDMPLPTSKLPFLQVCGSNSPKSKMGKYLQSLVAGSGGSDLAHGIYRLQVEGKDGGVYIIFICNGIRQVVEGDLPKVTPDVAVNISKEDLLAILDGSLPPLQAYLSGHLSVQGNIQMLMGLETLRQCNFSSVEKDGSFIV